MKDIEKGCSDITRSDFEDPQPRRVPRPNIRHRIRFHYESNFRGLLHFRDSIFRRVPICPDTIDVKLMQLLARSTIVLARTQVANAAEVFAEQVHSHPRDAVATTS